MKIRINKDVAEFTPEHAAEAAELEALWVKMGNCVGGNKALSPIGVYIPSENKTAVFHIDGLSEQEVRSFLEYQILTDFVLTNTDRHLNNFGVLRDSRTLQFVRMAPIFDSGNAMFWDAPRLPERNDCTEISVNSFRKTEMELLKLVTDRSRVHMERLPSREEIAELYAKDDSIAFVDSILAGYEKKKALLEHFMEKGIPAQNRHKRNIEPER